MKPLAGCAEVDGPPAGAPPGKYLEKGFDAVLLLFAAELLLTELFFKNGLFALGFELMKGFEVEAY